jgi:hypothetical protein
VSLERPATETSTFDHKGDAPMKSPYAEAAFRSHYRWVLLVDALGRVAGSWGTTLRVGFLVVAVGMTLRMLVGPIPWDQLAALLKLGG